jgi:hypothetical protein
MSRRTIRPPAADACSLERYAARNVTSSAESAEKQHLSCGGRGSRGNVARSEPTPAASRAHTMTFPSRHYRRCDVPYGPGRRRATWSAADLSNLATVIQLSAASAVAGNDRTRLSYVSAARTPFPRRRQAAGRDRLPWLWYRCDTVGQQVRISILAGQSRFALRVLHV